MSIDPHPWSFRVRRFAKRAQLGFLRQVAGRCAERSLIVSGVQRSGTNMVMNLLDVSGETDVYHEWDSRAFRDYFMKDVEEVGALRARSGGRLFAIKALNEAERVAELRQALAPAKALWVYRRPDDMVRSFMVSWPGSDNGLNWLVDDPLARGYQGRGMTAETLALVRELYHPNISIPSAIALFWYFRNQLFFDQGLHEDPHARLINYERLVCKPKLVAGGLFAWLELDFTPKAAGFIQSRAAKKKAPLDIEPPIRSLCDDMWARLEAAAAASPI